MRLRNWAGIGLLIMTLLLAACGPVGSTASPSEGVETEEGTAPDAGTEGDTVDSGTPAISETADPGGTPAGAAGDRSPDTIVIQFREGGGFTTAPHATILPQWTLYGDGFVVWTEQSDQPTPGFTQKVWTGTLTDDEINALVAYADEVGFWSLDPSYGTQATTGTSTNAPTLRAPTPDLPSSVIEINLAERQHSVQLYPADLEGAPEAYTLFRDR
ncbi:MAG: hypothetical protein ACRDIB_18890, partial [Ardenticatenaceae bacterium]